jgi:hypothetical protein
MGKEKSITDIDQYVEMNPATPVDSKKMKKKKWILIARIGLFAALFVNVVILYLVSQGR